MLAGLSKWELYSGDGQTEVLSCVDPSSGVRKCLEDPFNPESEAIEAIGSSLQDVSAVIIPPCSPRTIEALRSAAPDLKCVLVADNDPERLKLWSESFAGSLEACETIALPSNFHEAEELLRERLMRFECEIFLGGFAVYIPQRFRRLEKELSDFLESRVLYLQREACSAAATRSVWSWRSALNQLLNAPERQPSRLAATPEGERPEAVVIVGAGPSLDRNIQDLRELSDKAIIIATDAALNTMLENGVRPDLVASMDSGPLMWRLFEKALPRLDGLPLAASLGSSHVLYRAYPGEVLAFKDEAGGLPSISEGLPAVKHGKCVGHFAFHIAESLNPGSIVMVGFDLAYRDGQFHTSKMPYKGADDFKSSYRATETLVDAATGGKIASDLSLEFFLRYFEKAIAESPCEVVDATEGGALKLGARIATLREALSKLPPVRRPLAIAPNGEFLPERKAVRTATLRKSLDALSVKLRGVLEEAKAMERSKIRNPLRELDLESEEFRTASACANFLLMTEWVKALKDYPRIGFAKFKSLLSALSEDLLSCSETVSAALLAASGEWRRDASKSIVLVPDGMERAAVSALLSKLAPGAASVFDSKSPLHLLWKEMARLEAGRVFCFDGNSVPELWSVPKLPCFDVKTGFNPSPHDKTLWLPGYAALCLDEGVRGSWRGFLPESVACTLLEEARLDA